MNEKFDIELCMTDLLHNVYNCVISQLQCCVNCVTFDSSY